MPIPIRTSAPRTWPALLAGAGVYLLTASVPAALAGEKGPYPEALAGVRSRPAGLGLWGDLWWEASETVEVGPGVGVFFYWYEAQAKTRVTLADGFVILNGQLAAEPGWFLSAADRDGPRRFELRPLARVRAEVNLRNDTFWLYNRSTAWSRIRSRAEYDPFNDVVFDQGVELSGEQATALMISPSGEATRKAWFYIEGTLEGARGVGYINRRAHVGVILEKLSPSISLNLDGYYSFMDTDVGGLGAQAVLFVVPPRDRDEDPSKDATATAWPPRRQ